MRGERFQRVREGDHGVLRDESAAVKKQMALLSLDIIEGHGCVALAIKLVWPGSRIRVFARSATCIYVARGLVLVCAECSTLSFFL